MKSFHWAKGKVVGKDCLVSRTGYTGEDGFEIYTMDPDPGVIWTTLIETGRPRGLQPIGLGARDTLRLESKLSLYGNDISDTTTVLEADLKWIVKLDKGDFLGKPVIEKQLAEGLKRKIVGFEMAEPGIARPHYPVYFKGQKVGRGRLGHVRAVPEKGHRPRLPAHRGDRRRHGVRDRDPRQEDQGPRHPHALL